MGNPIHNPNQVDAGVLQCAGGATAAEGHGDGGVCAGGATAAEGHGDGGVSVG